MYSVAREAAKAWVTVEQVDHFRRGQSHPKGVVERVGNVEEEIGAVVGRGGQRGQMLTLATRSCAAAGGTAERRVTGWLTASRSGDRDPKEDRNRLLLSLRVRDL